jgi:indolepyruvate ferredoxin oxidoreductase
MALNGVQVERNQQAFAWGRQLAHAPETVRELLSGTTAQTQPSVQPIEWIAPETLASLVARRVAFLTDYQNAAYAARYQSLVQRVAEAEKQATGTERLAQAVARYFFKLMAYKDEYEVARLHTRPEFIAELKSQFEGDFRIVHHLAPPLFSGRNDKGELIKARYGPWVRFALRLLAPLKVLRGGPLDVFGYTEERRTERALIKRYETTLLHALPQLRPNTLESFVQWARIPEKIRGYGHVKQRHLQSVSAEWQTLEEAMTTGVTPSGHTGPRSSP